MSWLSVYKLRNNKKLSKVDLEELNLNQMRFVNLSVWKFSVPKSELL